MARSHFFQWIVNEEGQPVADASISVYLAGTTTAAYVYTQNSGGIPTNSIPQVTSNDEGLFEFWIANPSESQGYASNQKFKIEWEKPGYITAGFVDNVEIAAFPEEVDETDNNTVKNKLVSNYLAKIWTASKSVIVTPLAFYEFTISPQEVNQVAGPANTFTHTIDTPSATWGITHKINSRLMSVYCIDGNYMSVSPSAVAFDAIDHITITHSSPVSGWAILTGGENYKYYYDLNHNLGTEWVMFQCWDADRDELAPALFKVSPAFTPEDWVRIWIQSPFNAYIIYFI